MQDHGNITFQSQRIRTTKSKENTHQDHIADRGRVSMSHCNTVHKPLSIIQPVETPAAKVAMDRDRGEWTMKRLSLCGMMINATNPLFDRTHYHNSKLHRSYTNQVQQSHQTYYYIHRTFQNLVFYTQNVEHKWKSRSCTTFKIGMETRTLPALWPLHDLLLDSEKDRWLDHTLPPDASEG